MTVSAGTSVGFGRKSVEISVITYGGENLDMTFNECDSSMYK